MCVYVCVCGPAVQEVSMTQTLSSASWAPQGCSYGGHRIAPLHPTPPTHSIPFKECICLVCDVLGPMGYGRYWNVFDTESVDESKPHVSLAPICKCTISVYSNITCVVVNQTQWTIRTTAMYLVIV